MRASSKSGTFNYMLPDHLCVPGLDRPVTVSEYAQLKGIREAEVLASSHALKISSAFFRGQWYVEAPPNYEERLAQLRREQQTRYSGEKITDMHADARRESEVERLRAHFIKSHFAYNRLATTEQNALLNTREYAERI